MYLSIAGVACLKRCTSLQARGELHIAVSELA